MKGSIVLGYKQNGTRYTKFQTPIKVSLDCHITDKGSILHVFDADELPLFYPMLITGITIGKDVMIFKGIMGKDRLYYQEIYFRPEPEGK